MSTLASYEPAAIPPLASDIAKKINALHSDVQRLEKESRQKLNNAVSTAWQAGKLLLDAKASVVRHGGRGAWLTWLRTSFKGGIRTAQRYMKLARELPNPVTPMEMSLRQIYFRLGIATEPKRATGQTHIGKLPEHITLANKLVRVLRSSKQVNVNDMAALYSQLRTLFDSK